MTKKKKEIKDLVPNASKNPAGGKLPTVMGRPKGAKNKDTLFKELMTGEFQGIAKVNIQKTFEVLFEKAQSGDMKAIKIILDRVVPVTKAVDLADMEKKGLTINITVGEMESPQISGEIVEDAEFTEVSGE